uniref:Uncharacterized protein n=1 Tax=Picea sitchensis TaxID=3332 RepID=C0PTF7_PICSI|nr:unknown [Picea sitchensis]
MDLFVSLSPIAGVLFPLLIMLLVPARQYILPKFFKGAHLQELDATDYEEAPAMPCNIPEVGIQGFGLGTIGARVDDGEVLHEMITRSHGEVKHAYSPRITSSSECTPIHESKSAFSP